MRRRTKSEQSTCNLAINFVVVTLISLINTVDCQAVQQNHDRAVVEMDRQPAVDGLTQPNEIQPNVILIMVDDMRYDFLSGEGHPYIQTPNIDRLASEGTSFRRAYVATPKCGQNRASIHTGLLAPQHGIINHQIHLDPKSFYPNGNFLPASIHDEGLYTSMIAKWFHSPNVLPRPEYDRWFVHVAGGHTSRTYSIDGVITSNAEAAAIAGSPYTYASDIEFYETARLANENRANQFFTFVSPFEPHPQFVPAPRHNGTYDGNKMPQLPNFGHVEKWFDFNPVASDRLLANINMTLDTVESLEGMDFNVEGINAGYTSGDLEFHANTKWQPGNYDPGEFLVTGSCFYDGTSDVDIGYVGYGLAVSDDAQGTGFIMHSVQNVFERFDHGFREFHARHLVAVRFNGERWQYNNDLVGYWPNEVAEIQTDYNNQAEMMLAIDEGVGHLYTELEQLGILENTVIIFTSDNGIHLGQQKICCRKKTPYEESCRIPLIVRYGSNVTGQGPVDADQLISQADLMMTIVELVGGTIPPPAKNTNYYGRSLASEWLGKQGTGDVNRRNDVICLQHHDNPADNNDNLDNDGMVWGSIITDDGWKYVDLNLHIGDDVDAEKYEYILNGIVPGPVRFRTLLFNLNEDPYELNNLADKCEFLQVREELQQRLSDQLLANSAEFVFAPASPNLHVDAINVIRGFHQQGDESSLASSDDDRLVYSPGVVLRPNEPPVWLELEGQSTCFDPAQTTFTIETSANTPGIQQTVELFNYYHNEYEEMDVRFTSLRDSEITIDLTSPQHYFSSTGRVKARIGFKVEGLIWVYPWKVRIDRVEWEIGQ